MVGDVCVDVGGWNGTDGRAKILIRARGEWMLERQQRGTKQWITSGKTIRFTPESGEEGEWQQLTHAKGT